MADTPGLGPGGASRVGSSPTEGTTPRLSNLFDGRGVTPRGISMLSRYSIIMKIHFVGLSCFLIENKRGFRILVDSFNDAPEWTLGPVFPKEFQGKPFGANIVLMSEPDADHAYAPGGWLQNAPATRPDSNPFPGLNLRGTVVYEHNGDVNIAWHYTVDGLRVAHFADHAHVLAAEQLFELGSPDIIFLSPPKTDDKSALDIIRKNIEQLRPKVVVWAHHIVPEDLPKTDDPSQLRQYFQGYFQAHASTNQGYRGTDSFMEICYVLENAAVLNKEYAGLTMDTPTLEIVEDILERAKDGPQAVLFRSMLARSVVE